MPLSWGGASADPMPSPYKGWAKGQEEKIKDNYALRENSEKSWNWLIEPIPGLNRHLYCQRQEISKLYPTMAPDIRQYVKFNFLQWIGAPAIITEGQQPKRSTPQTKKSQNRHQKRNRQSSIPLCFHDYFLEAISLARARMPFFFSGAFGMLPPRTDLMPRM